MRGPTETFSRNFNSHPDTRRDAAPWDNAAACRACGPTPASRRDRAPDRGIKATVSRRARRPISPAITEACLPALFEDGEPLTVRVLSLSALRSEACDLRPAAGWVRLDHGDAALLE